MKGIVFTPTERNLLVFLMKKMIDYRTSYCSNFKENKSSQKRFNNEYIKPAISALHKITFEKNAKYSIDEKVKIMSCINENLHHLDKIEKGAPFFNEAMVSLDLVSTIEIYNNLIAKCDYSRKKDHFHLQDMLTRN